MKSVFVLLYVFILTGTISAQKKPGFSSQNYVGILEGESGTSLQLQTINGIRFKTWFAGAGLGLDYYYYRSIPAFISVSKFLNSSKLPLYFTGDIGMNFPWKNKGTYYYENPGEFSPSLYWAGGMGYKFGFKKSGNALLLNLGYNYKRLTQTYESVSLCLVAPCPVYTEKYDYRLKRLSVKIGWMF